MARLLVLGALAALIALPLWLRDAVVAEHTGGDMPVLVVITPHNEAIRQEFADAFAAWYRRERGGPVVIDWRSPGGTTEIVRFLEDRYATAFAAGTGAGFTATARQAFNDRGADGAPPPDADEAIRQQHAARAAFLAGADGVGIDLMFGGGQFEFAILADKGYLVADGAPARHPDWFVDDVMPARLAGNVIHDGAGRYHGACLSAFGLCANPDRYADLGLPLPQAWRDLGDPRLIGAVALADPTKSGSIAACYEMILQEQLAAAVAAAGSEDPAVLDAGWRDGFTLIKRLAANARTISGAASDVTRAVAMGDAAAGMCIDFYGRSEAEWSARVDGRERLVYRSPTGGTAVTADPIGLLRGAAHGALARDFIDFVLSTEGQHLWNRRVGTPDGPRRWALRRLPVRRDCYTPEDRALMSDPNADPFALAEGFLYRGDWTGRYFTLMRATVRAVVLDPEDELRDAWRAIIAAGGPEHVPAAMTALAWLPYAHHDADAARTALKAPAAERLPLLRGWTLDAQAAYRRAAALAREGR